MKQNINANEAVIVLGSGPSINFLTEDEKSFISNSYAAIAMNKFMAFYKESGVLPSHVYFHDLHENSGRFLQHVFEVCIRDNIQDLTFIVSDCLRGRLASTRLERAANWLRKKRPNISSIAKLRNPRSNLKLLCEPFNQIAIPRNCSFNYISVTDFLTGGSWATSLNDRLYHFRGSLTTVLNYVTICFPGKDIYLVGTDFGSDRYFFEENLSELEFNWKDWTFDLVKERKLHFSAQVYEGTTMFDEFPFILQSLRDSGNRVYCVNPDSLLVTRGLVEYKQLPIQPD